MSDEPGSDRRSPVGEPVVRADPEITGDRAAEAIGFDPDDPDSVAEAATVVHRFATGDVGGDDHVLMLRGAAACAALVRGTGSYKHAAERAGDGVSVSFIRKWARVHDLPQAIRRHVARGHIPPTAAKHIARVGGRDRYLLAWGAIDGGLTVRDVRAIASDVNDGTPIEAALREHDVVPGRITLDLPIDAYVALRREASMRNEGPGSIVGTALEATDRDDNRDA
ncbi:hypothetical protein [Halopenitus sp. POP-27]|uniref:DUF7119 family protein n=1 Tax=Halopenitus sp. POP-27 TaxID=2994425 RepID=UPI0024685881|nr:hypothetical protein [Halopenitus sp. POP-27]